MTQQQIDEIEDQRETVEDLEIEIENLQRELDKLEDKKAIESSKLSQLKHKCDHLNPDGTKEEGWLICGD
jgi:predicted RNase H-like nuclease (RuvC/YqgF family)